MEERLKELRKKLNLTQQAFADKLGIKRNTIANYEVGRNEPIDAIISLICREFNVNETWLRTGEGPMFIELNRETQLIQWAEQALKGETDSFKHRFLQMLMSLNENDWKLLEEKAKMLFEDAETSEHPDKNAHDQSSESFDD